MLGRYDGSGFRWPAMMILGLVALIGLAAWAIARLTRTEHHDAPAGPVDVPRAILDRRYAAGDIDAETYAQMRRMLEGRGAPDAPARTAKP